MFEFFPVEDFFASSKVVYKSRERSKRQEKIHQSCNLCKLSHKKISLKRIRNISKKKEKKSSSCDSVYRKSVNLYFNSELCNKLEFFIIPPWMER